MRNKQMQILLVCFGIPLLSFGQKSFNDAGKFGFTEDGKTIIQPQYEYATDFIEGLACVKKDGKWGYINTSNTWVSNKYEKIQPLNRGFGKVYANGKFGLVDSVGTEIFPTEYDDLYINYDGHYILEKNGLKGLQSNNIEVPCNYKKTGQYHEDYAWGKNEDDTYDIYDENGLILKSQGSYIGRWSVNADNNFVATEDGNYGLFNVKTKEWSLKPKYEYITTMYCEVYVNGDPQTYLLYGLFKEMNEVDNFSIDYSTSDKNEIEIRSLTNKKIKIKGVKGYIQESSYSMDYTIYFDKSENDVLLSELIKKSLKL